MSTRPPLHRLLQGSPYRAYLYSYPHKTAHHPLSPPVPLDELWRHERKDALFLYIHVPFCEMRCGYCNLFSSARPRPEQVSGFLATLERQARIVREALGEARFARVALGGGTPTVLAVAELERLLRVSDRIMGADLAAVPVAVEVSPRTVDADKLRLLRQRGADRLSIGIQSFVEVELGALQRRQERGQIHRALEQIRAEGFPTLNIDLIYGIAGQTPASWQVSLDEALRYRPEEIYLYPLYVRPLTPLARRAPQGDDRRLELYRAGRDRLLAEGYTQISMRMFRAAHAPNPGGPVYRCQEDGMVGLACGARSYTERLHYSSEWAVSPKVVRQLIDAYIQRSDDAFRHADHGIELDEEDRRRRFVILSLLLKQGLDLPAYRRRFGSEAVDDLPQLAELALNRLARHDDERLVLTDRGLELSDLLGPWLHSERVRLQMERYDLR